MELTGCCSVKVKSSHVKRLSTMLKFTREERSLLTLYLSKHHSKAFKFHMLINFRFLTKSKWLIGLSSNRQLSTGARRFPGVPRPAAEAPASTQSSAGRDSLPCGHHTVLHGPVQPGHPALQQLHQGHRDPSGWEFHLCQAWLKTAKNLEHHLSAVCWRF